MVEFQLLREDIEPSALTCGFYLQFDSLNGVLRDILDDFEIRDGIALTGVVISASEDWVHAQVSIRRHREHKVAARIRLIPGDHSHPLKIAEFDIVSDHSGFLAKSANKLLHFIMGERVEEYVCEVIQKGVDSGVEKLIDDYRRIENGKGLIVENDITSYYIDRLMVDDNGIRGVLKLEGRIGLAFVSVPAS